VTDAPETRIADLDADSLGALELTGLLCFRCPLLEDPRLPATESGTCRTRVEDLKPIAADPRSGIKAAVVKEKIVGYSVFGRPALFRNIASLPFEVDPSALLVAALYATPEALEENIDVDLLVAVMDFAREQEYRDVAVVCRTRDDDSPEARAPMLGAAGFSLTEETNGLCLAQTTVEQWDSGGDEAEEE
jgi:hypothetical protein